MCVQPEIWKILKVCSFSETLNWHCKDFYDNKQNPPDKRFGEKCYFGILRSGSNDENGIL